MNDEAWCAAITIAVVQKLQPLRAWRRVQDADLCDVTAWSVQASNLRADSSET